MARHQIRAAKPKPEKPKAELRAAPSWYDRTHPVGSAERFLDHAAREALAAAAAGGLAEPRQLAAGAVKAIAKKASEYPDPLLQRAAELPAAELARRAARAEAYNQAMKAQNGVVQAMTASLSPVADLARSQASAALATRQAAEGGDAGADETPVSETPVSGGQAPSGGPRIVINPTTFKNSKDALCVAFNEGFRLWMEANDFQPQSEPTDAQRKFFSDTAYADDEVQLRRTILARIATFDTSVKDPTDDQLSETASFLNAILESDWCRNDWERNSVQKLARAVEASVGAEPVEPRMEPVEPRSEEPLTARAALGGGETEDDEEKPEDGAVRYVEKDGSYYRQTYVEGETDASTGWRGEAIGKDEWDSAQRNIEKGVSAQRFAEAWDAGTEDWNKQQKEIRGLMDKNTEAHNEVNRMVADGTMTPERGQSVHSSDSGDKSWIFRGSETGALLAFGADSVKSVYGPGRRDYIEPHASGDRGILNQTRTLDLDLNEDELAKKATSSALAGLANMEPDKTEPQVAEVPETPPVAETPPAPETAVAESRAESVAETPAAVPATKETVQQGGDVEQPQNGMPTLATYQIVQDERPSGGTSGHTVAERRERHPLRMNGPSIAPVRPIGDIGATSFTDTKRMNGPSIEPERAIGTIDTADGSGGSTLRRKKRRRSRT